MLRTIVVGKSGVETVAGPMGRAAIRSASADGNAIVLFVPDDRGANSSSAPTVEELQECLPLPCATGPAAHSILHAIVAVRRAYIIARRLSSGHYAQGYLVAKPISSATPIALGAALGESSPRTTEDESSIEYTRASALTTAYTGPYFTGRCQLFSMTAIPNLSTFGLFDEVRSLRVAGTCLIAERPYFAGAKLVVHSPNVIEIGDLIPTSFGDRAASILAY